MQKFVFRNNFKIPYCTRIHVKGNPENDVVRSIYYYTQSHHTFTNKAASNLLNIAQPN